MGASACWYDKPAPVIPHATVSAPVSSTTSTEADATPDYRAWTIAFDAVGAAALVGGSLALRSHGLNDNIGGSLAVGGLALGGYGAIVAHLAHHRGDRAWRSFLVRSMLVNAGGLAGLVAGCPDGADGLGALDCSITGMMLGAAGGIAVAGVFDAFVLQNDSRWVPTATVSGDGSARVGIGTAF